MPKHAHTARRGNALTLTWVSLASLAILSGLLAWLGGYFSIGDSADEIVVFCAAGARRPIEEIAKQYEDEYGGRVRLQYNSSGSLESTIEVSPRGDLFIPAAVDPFILRTRKNGLVAEAIPLAKFRLVLAVRPGYEIKIETLEDLFRHNVPYVVANEKAAVGKKTRILLQKSGDWERIKAGAKAFKPTVTELALDIKEGVAAHAGFIWDANAKQHGLQIVDLPELAGGESTITAGVLTKSENPAAALRFARYLAAQEKGQKIFRKYHFAELPGDAWAPKPKITLFSGGVNRAAIEDTLRAFQEREGCQITTVFAGCGKLVGLMKPAEEGIAPRQPDAYFACDISYVDKVRDLFLDSTDVSMTDLVILVRKGNPKQIKNLSDLAGDGIDVGMAHETHTALGNLTMQLLEKTGVKDEVLKNRKATTPTADLLVLQLTANDKLDAVIVYEANCSKVRDETELIRIDHPAAHAVQPFAVHKENKYPQLTQRLLDAIRSRSSQRRFESVGFKWVADEDAP